MKKSSFQLISFILGFFLCAMVSHAKEGGGYIASTPGGAAYGAMVEFESAGTASFTARAGGLDYYIEDGSYWEEGSATMFGIGGRFYSERSMKGMFFGAGVDYASGDFSWGDWPSYGYGSFSGIVPSASVGYKTYYQDLTLEPSLYIIMIGDQAQVAAGLQLFVGKSF